jgi:mono/diheme cytochrome c family protein
MLTRTMMTAALVLALSEAAWAQDPARGRALAQQRCAACHDIDGGSRSSRRSAPTFRDIARQPGFNAGQLTVALAYGHIPMGGGQIGPGDAGDLAAYIRTLRRR